jgi:8-oxo-dGTP pyrophosphatase MutT (NUDIX family)
MVDSLHRATISVRGVLIHPRGQILLLQRVTDDEWELPGGRLESNEDTVVGLQREIIEETDLSVEIEEIVAANSWVNESGQDRFAVHYRCYTIDRVVDISAEHTDWTWVNPQDGQSLLCETQAAAVEAATRITDRQQSPQSLLHNK